MSPLSFLERLQTISTPRHIPVALLRVESFLRAAGYDPERVMAALAHIDAHGTARECTEIDLEDRPAVEELVPERLRREHECFPECECCTDGESFRRGLLRPAGRPLKSPDDGDLDAAERF